MVKKEYKDLSKKEKIIGWSALAVVVLIIIAMVSGGGEKIDSETGSDVQKIEGTNLSKNAVETACQDAKYGVNDGYKPIDMLDYNFNTYEYAYDKDGNSIIIAEWNGKKEDTDEGVKFQCYVSGKDDKDITIHYIRAGGQDVWKKMTDLNFDSYDKDGNPVYSELHEGTSETGEEIKN